MTEFVLLSSLRLLPPGHFVARFPSVSDNATGDEFNDGLSRIFIHLNADAADELPVGLMLTFDDCGRHLHDAGIIPMYEPGQRHVLDRYRDRINFIFAVLNPYPEFNGKEAPLDSLQVYRVDAGLSVGVSGDGENPGAWPFLIRSGRIWIPGKAV